MDRRPSKRMVHEKRMARLHQTAAGPFLLIKKNLLSGITNRRSAGIKPLTYLKNEDLSALSAGIHEIVGRDVYILITEYNSKNL